MEVAKEQNLTKKYTTRDYIQDGLVAMWDGIENAGYNRHDTDIVVWKDLIGNFDLNVTGTYDDSTFNNGSNTTIIPKTFSYDTDLTFCGRFLYSGTGWDKWCYLGIGRDSGVLNGLTIGGIDGQFNCRYQDRYANPTCMIIVPYDNAQVGCVYSCCVVFHRLDKSFEFYVDGKLVGQSVISDDVWNLDGMEVGLGYGKSYNHDIPLRRYNGMVYDRALMQWEIAHNYDIDIKRFGI